VLDGEIVVATDGGLDFEALQQCIHPAVSRVIMLGEKTPASFIAFDLLALGDEDYTGRPFAAPSAALEAALADAKAPIHLTPTTTDLEVTNRWFVELEGAHLDGVIAKPLDGTYTAARRRRRLPGNVSRWNATRDLSFAPLRPERALEVKYEHMEGTRFRHMAHFVRWREDRTPESCTYEQPVTYPLADIVSTLGRAATR
jgi:ATP-dependent DNA ligase